MNVVKKVGKKDVETLMDRAWQGLVNIGLVRLVLIHESKVDLIFKPVTFVLMLTCIQHEDRYWLLWLITLLMFTFPHLKEALLLCSQCLLKSYF